MRIIKTRTERYAVASFPGLWRARKGGKTLGARAWGLLRAHARKIPFIFRIIRRKISDNDVIVHGESARKEYADTFSTVTATSSRRICFHLLLPTIAPGAVKRNVS